MSHKLFPQTPVLTDEHWETINQKMGVDVIDIAINLDNRFTPNQQAELIVERCNLTAEAQRDYTERNMIKQFVEWLFDWCTEHEDSMYRRRNCPDCLKALQKLAEEVK